MFCFSIINSKEESSDEVVPHAVFVRPTHRMKIFQTEVDDDEEEEDQDENEDEVDSDNNKIKKNHTGFGIKQITGRKEPEESEDEPPDYPDAFN